MIHRVRSRMLFLLPHLPMLMILAILVLHTVCPPRRLQVPLAGLCLLCMTALLVVLLGNVAPRTLVLCASVACGVCLSLSVLLARAECWFGFPCERIVRVEGTLRFDPGMGASGNTVLHLTLDAVGDRHGGRAEARGHLLVVGRLSDAPLAGSLIAAEGRLGSFDGQGMLFLADSFRPLSHEGAFHAIRTCALRHIGERLDLLGPEPSRVGRALLLGDAGAASALRELAVRSGSSHVLALSGMHLHVLVAVLAMILRRFGRRGSILVDLGAVMYVSMVGFKPSLTRALLLLPLRRIGKGMPFAWTLMLAFALQLLVFPQTIDSAGTVLSYASLHALSAFCEPLSKRLSFLLPHNISLALGASVAVSVALAPLSILLFGTWFPVGMVLALILVPLTMSLLVGCLAWTFVPVSPVRELLGFLSAIFKRVVEFGSMWSNLHADADPWNLWVSVLVTVLTVAIVLGYACRATNRRKVHAYDLGFSLRFTERDLEPARGTLPCDVEEIRTELPHLRTHAVPHHRQSRRDLRS